MKIFFLFFVMVEFGLRCSHLNTQENVSAGWKYNFEMDFYFTDPFFILPIIQADDSKLHLEARYNYEELKTISIWSGYNFSGGKDFQYDIVPMAGGLAGRINGAGAGFELTFDFRGLELYSASEYLFDFNDKENNFFYNWTDFTYSPVDWFFFGVSDQRTKVYQTDTDVQYGILAGGNYKNFQTSVYYYNPGLENKFFFFTISAGF